MSMMGGIHLQGEIPMNEIVQTGHLRTVMDAKALRAQINAIQEVMRDVMLPGKHYGKIPGCGDKDVLFKPGAEKIMATFGIRPEVEVLEIQESDGHRRFRVKVRALSTDGLFLGEGIGEGSTAEDKYAWEGAKNQQHFDETPETHRRKKWISNRGGGYKQINQVATNIWDRANTVLKMAKKRALVDMVLTVTAASDIFEQDLDEEHLRPSDMVEPPTPVAPPQRKSAAKPKQPVGEQLHRKGIVTNVTQKPTSTGGTRYGVQIDGQDWFNTFEKEFAQLAKEQSNGYVEILYTVGKYGNDIVNIEVSDPDIAPDPAED